MFPLLRVLPALLALPFLGMAKKPEFLIRFFVEASASDSDHFSSPIKFEHPPREAFIEKGASLSERNVKAVFPFQASDGSWGCAFRLDEKGRIDLESLSTMQRGRSIVVFVGTSKGSHQVIDMVIDRRVSDGIIYVPRGLSELEIAAISKEFPVIVGKREE